MKKAAPTILQTEVRTQEEWDGLMQRKGLGVVDVYSKWCGPCKAIVSLFRKIRNEQEDDFLFFATAEADCIDSLADYKGKSQPTFLFYGDGQLVNVLRGCDGPMITKLIVATVAKERKIAEGICDREQFIDKVVSKEPEAEEKQDAVKEHVNEADEELVSKQVGIVIIKPDAVEGGHTEQILEEVVSAGHDILQKVERSFTSEEIAELYKQDDGDNFDQRIQFMTSGPCVVVAVSKSADIIGEEIVTDLLTLCGPGDVNTAKEEAPESLRAKYGTDSLHNAVGSSLSDADASRELAFFFPDLVVPTVKHLIQQKTLQRTVALIRPNAFEQKDDIIKAIEDNGFLIAIQKEIVFTKETAEEFYSQYKDEETFEMLISKMTSGPSLALCLVKNNAVEAWKDMLAPKENEVLEGEENEAEEGNEKDPVVSLQVKFAVSEGTCEPLHASDSPADFEREMKIVFPMENVVVVIQPDTYKNDDERGTIMSSIKKAGFNIVVQKEVTMTSEQVSTLYKEYIDTEVFEELWQYMSSGPSQFLILSREDAVDGLQSLLGPAHPEKAKELFPDSLRGQFGKDGVRHAIYGSESKDNVADVIKGFCSDIVFDENGLVCEPVPGIAETEENITEATVEPTETELSEGATETVGEVENANSDAPADGPTSADDSSVPPTSADASREGTLDGTNTEDGDTTT